LWCLPILALGACQPEAAEGSAASREGTAIAEQPLAVCGDGFTTSPEACDDGNTVSEDACPYDQPSCTSCDATCSSVLSLTGPYCGDGVLNGPEACDDGNTVTETSCPYGQASCTACDATCSSVLSLTGESCGDGITTGAEVCDDGNTVTETACPYGQTSCTTCDATCANVVSPLGAYCGDGVRNGPEACDDGNTVSETSCPAGQTFCVTCNATCSDVLTPKVPPNVHFLVDTSGSMQELMHTRNSDHAAFFAQGDGCTNPSLLATQAARGWNPATQYPVPDTGTGFGSDYGYPNLFQDSRYYGYMTWGYSTNPTPTWSTKEAACGQQHPGDRDGTSADGDQDVQYAQCLVCLDTKGFYKKPGAVHNNTTWADSRMIFWGRYLNFDPPRHVTTRVALKNAFKTMQGVRVGFSEFRLDSASGPNGARMVRTQNPSCDQLIQNSSAFDSNRASYINSVNTLVFDKGTPLANALLNVGQFFSSTDDIYRARFGFSDYVFRSDYRNYALTSQSRSWCWGSQRSSVVIITDGEPSGTDVLPSTTFNRVKTLNGGAVACPAGAPCSDASNYKLDDVARFLATQDLQQTAPSIIGNFNSSGQQSLTTYVVNIGLDESNLLKNTASVSGGSYYLARDGAALQTALQNVLQEITEDP
jgi:type IV pilus assembly protein PilY1